MKLRRFLYDPNSAAGAAPVASPVAPAPQAPAATPPSAPAAPNPTPAPAGDGIGVLSGDRRILVPGADGREVEVTIGDMHRAWQELPKTQAQADLFARAFEKNDPQAIQEIVKKYLPDAAPPPPPAPTPQYVTKEELAAWQKSLGADRELIEQIRTAATRTQLDENITAKKVDHPYLAKHSQRVDLVQDRLNHYANIAKQQNIDLAAASPEIRGKVLAKAMSDVEGFLATTMKELMPAQPQGMYGQPSAPPVERPANYIFDPNTGNFIKNPAVFGAPASQGSPPAALPTGQVIPSSGANPNNGLPQQPSNDRPFTTRDMVERMRTRNTQLQNNF